MTVAASAMAGKKAAVGQRSSRHRTRLACHAARVKGRDFDFTRFAP
ncbi:hypothetical protein F9288_09575 [Sphingomonas sp. CL5.1]|nr:hypothetical protein [Sphingomonas sp. CL5.1]QKR99858.1 hypothetical protein F9288_09575 [Sphingomonas sp. CL5.1]